MLTKLYVTGFACLLITCLFLTQRVNSGKYQLEKAHTELLAEKTANLTLQATLEQKNKQISALRVSGQLCEDARLNDVAAAAMRRAILEQGGSVQKAVAAPATPGAVPLLTERQSAEMAAPPPHRQNQEQARVCMAVADYLNRPL